ncbi:MAG: ATP-binding protein [Candidatus Aminicenantes bacterium]|jgi:PAS domain S-box-containing protein
MSFLPFLHFFSFLVYLYLGGLLLLKNPKSSLNRVCSAFLSCFVVYSFAMIFVHNPVISKHSARLFYNFSSFGWTSFPAFYLWFLLIFTRKQKILNAKLFYLFLVVLFGLPLLFIYNLWSGSLMEDLVRQPYGWAFVWSETAWPYLFCLYFLLNVGAGIFITFDFTRKTENLMKKKQARIIVNTSIVSYILGSLVNIILPFMRIYTIPQIANVMILSLAFGIVYAITKYKLFVLTPAAAAENIVETMCDALLLVDTNARIINVNSAALGLLGFQKKEIIGKSFAVFFEEEQFKELWHGELIPGNTEVNREATVIPKNGGEIPVLFSGSVMRDNEGDIQGVVCVVRDITGQKELQQRLVRQEKLALLGQLAGGLGHELRNPLGVIKNTAYFLNMALENPEPEVKESLEILEKEVGNSERIIRSLLDFARARPPHRQEVDINQILQEVLSGIKVPEQIQLKSHLVEAIPFIMGDPDQLTQVFGNIIHNAVQAMPQGGQLMIKSETREPGWIAVSITDTGVGIAEENIGKIFEPLFTGKAKGIGLGMAISKTFVEGHGGSINVQSEIGKGSTFTVKLPIGKK